MMSITNDYQFLRVVTGEVTEGLVKQLDGFHVFDGTLVDFLVVGFELNFGFFERLDLGPCGC
jgi:hypothetical protein